MNILFKYFIIKFSIYKVLGKFIQCYKNIYPARQNCFRYFNNNNQNLVIIKNK